MELTSVEIMTYRRNCDISDPKIGSSKMGIRITLFFEQRRGEGVAGSSAA